MSIDRLSLIVLLLAALLLALRLGLDEEDHARIRDFFLGAAAGPERVAALRPLDPPAAAPPLDNRFEIAAERMAIHVPASWIIDQEGQNDRAVFAALPHGWALFAVTIQSYEVPDAIAQDDLAPLLHYVGMPDGVGFGRAALDQQVVRWRAHSESGRPLTVWQRAQVLGDHLRRAEFILQVEKSYEDTAEHLELEALADQIVRNAAFSPRLERLDDVAPSPSLQRINIDDVVLMRLPVEWEMEELEDGRTAFSHPSRREGDFYLRWDYFGRPGAVPPPDEIADVKIMEEERTSEEEGHPVYIRSWRMIVTGTPGILLIQAHYVVLEKDRHRREVRQRTEILDRELRRAVLMVPDSDRFPPRPLEAFRE